MALRSGSRGATGSMEDKFQELTARLREIEHLKSAVWVLLWDQRTYMPEGGASARAHQVGTLYRLIHEKMTDPDLGRLVEDLRSYEQGLPFDSDEASLIRVARRAYDKLVRVPAAFQAEFDAHKAMSYQVWTRARPANDFPAVRPYLEKTLEYSRQYAEFFDYDHIMDPLIDLSDPDVTVADLCKLFGDLRKCLVPLLQAISAKPAPDDSFLYQAFPIEGQLAFAKEISEQLGYDLNRGRIDLSAHPVSMAFSCDDVRITTRVKENNLKEALFSTLHEAGHAIHAQNLRPELDGTPLAHAPSHGLAESQSRLWENLVGRSRVFWEFAYPRLQMRFPDRLGDISLETFYASINKVEPSPIRTSADEVTYNLHCVMRFQIELDLLEGNITVGDLPEVWRERLQKDFGIVLLNDRDGVLQDMNWYSDWIGGMYQGYTLGNIMSAQLFSAAVQAHPEIPSEIANGMFDTLRDWLTKNIYQHGGKYTAFELIERATGRPLNVEPFLNYLHTKYGELYTL